MILKYWGLSTGSAGKPPNDFLRFVGGEGGG